MNLPVGVHQADSVCAAEALGASRHVHRIRSAQHLLNAAKVLPTRVDEHLHMSSGRVALHSVLLTAACSHVRPADSMAQAGDD